ESGLEQRVHLLLAVQLDPVLVAQLWKERELLLWRLERFEAPLQRGANGAGAGDYQALPQAYEKSDGIAPCALGLALALAKVCGDRLVEQPWIPVTLLPGVPYKVRTPGSNERFTLGVDRLALLRASDVGLDPLILDAADVGKRVR